jgi:hypothetical protein
MMPHQSPYQGGPNNLQYHADGRGLVVPTITTTANSSIPTPFIGGVGTRHDLAVPYATTPLTFQTTPIAGSIPYPNPHYHAAPPVHGSLLAPPPAAAAAAAPGAVSPMVAKKKPNGVKLNTVTVSPTKSTDAHKKQKRKNKVSKEDLKRAMNIPISSKPDNKSNHRTKEDIRLKKRETNLRGRETIRNAIEVKSKRRGDPNRDGIRRSKRKRNPEKRFDDCKEKRRLNENHRDEYDSESDEEEEDEEEEENDDDYEEEERERRHDSRSRSRRRNGNDFSDDSYIDRRRRDDSYRDGPSRNSRSRRRNEQRYNDYEYDAVEVGIDDEPWYFQASDMIQDSCPALNCDGYAEPVDYYADHTRQGRQRFHETRNKTKPNARRTDCCGDEVVIPQWLLFAVGGMIGCCFIF